MRDGFRCKHAFVMYDPGCPMPVAAEFLPDDLACDPGYTMLVTAWLDNNRRLLYAILDDRLSS